MIGCLACITSRACAFASTPALAGKDGALATLSIAKRDGLDRVMESLCPEHRTQLEALQRFGRDVDDVLNRLLPRSGA